MLENEAYRTMKNNKILFAAVSAILVIFVVLTLWIWIGADPGEQVVISQDNREIYRLDINKDQELRIDSPDGGYNVIRVQDGQVSVTEADCPDQVCVRQGEVSDDAVPIVCLPHKLVIEVTAESDKDAVG